MYGAFHADVKRASLPDLPPVNEDYLLKKMVAVKIRNWYGVKDS